MNEIKIQLEYLQNRMDFIESTLKLTSLQIKKLEGKLEMIDRRESQDEYSLVELKNGFLDIKRHVDALNVQNIHMNTLSNNIINQSVREIEIIKKQQEDISLLMNGIVTTMSDMKTILAEFINGKQPDISVLKIEHSKSK